MSVRGKFISSTPSWSGSIWANWKTQAAPGVNICASASYRSKVFVNTLELLPLPDQVIVTMAARYRIGLMQANVAMDNLLGYK